MGTGGSFSGGRAAGYVKFTTHPPPTSAVVKNTWIYTFTPPTCLHGVVFNWLNTGTRLSLPLRFEVLTAVVMKNPIFWDITLLIPGKSTDVSREAEIYYLIRVGVLLGLFFDMLHRNVGKLSAYYRPSYPRRYNPSKYKSVLDQRKSVDDDLAGCSEKLKAVIS
jgi:hypothetical protein